MSLGFRLFQNSRHLRPLLLAQRRSVVNRLISPFIGTFGLTGFIALETVIAFGLNSLFAILPSVISGLYPVVTTIAAVGIPVVREIANILIPSSPIPWNDYLVGLSLYYGALFLQGIGVWTLTTFTHHYQVILGAMLDIFNNIDMAWYQRLGNILIFVPMGVYHFGLLPLWEAIQLIYIGNWEGLQVSEAATHLNWIWLLVKSFFGYASDGINLVAPPIIGMVKYSYLGIYHMITTCKTVITGVIMTPVIGLSWVFLWILHLIGL